MIVQVRRDVVGGQLLEDLLLQGCLLVVAVGAVPAASIQDLNAVAQVLAAGHAELIAMVAIKRKCVHNACVSGVVQDAL